MEKIMARFSNFNSLISSNSNNQDEDEDDDEDKKEEADLERDDHEAQTR